MEKTIKFEDVIAFIRKAMNDGLEMHKDSFSESIDIYTSYNSHIIPDYKFSIVTGLLMYIGTPRGRLHINITEKEHNLFKVIMDNVGDYSHDMAVKDFNDFFKDDENRVKDIDDLDDDDK